MTAQTLVRILSHGGYKEVCGIVPSTGIFYLLTIFKLFVSTTRILFPDLVTTTTTWGDILINPHVKVYEKPEKAESMEVEHEDQQVIEETNVQTKQEGK